MGFFDRLFGKKPSTTVTTESKSLVVEPTLVPDPLADYEEVPFYLPADVPEKELVSVIAAAVAAGAYPETEFAIKKLMVKNPEAQLVTLIAASIAAGDEPDKQLVVRSIYRKK